MNNELSNEKKKNNKVFSKSETILLVIFSLIIGLCIGFIINKNNLIGKSDTKQDEYLNEFIENYEYIIDNYYKDIDKEKLINSAIAGMMDSLDDPYSMYFNEEEADNFSLTLDGSYQGIGVQISKDNQTGYMKVETIFKNSPAEQAGLLVGDLIIAVDDKDAKEMETSEFSSLIKNGEKSTYNLKILRDSEEKEITINKELVTLTSVTSEIFERENKKIGYIYIGVFANNTYEQFKTELNKLEEQKIEYLIIDVRSNTGGHLTAVSSILDLFLTKTQIKYQFLQNDEKTLVYGNAKANKNYEIVLLGDEASASASEVLIAALKENLNSKLIGKKTYGKGTVQEMVTLPDGTKYKITVKKWLTPKGNWINDTEGIMPDIEVALDSKYFDTNSDDDDNQLQKALEYIVNK